MAVQFQNLAGTGGGSKSARATSLTLPAARPQNESQQGVNLPFEQALRKAKPQQSGSTDVAEKATRSKRESRPSRAERPEPKPNRRAEESAAGDSTDQPTDTTSTQNTETENDSTYAIEEETSEASSSAAEAAADGSDDRDDDAGQAVTNATEAANLSAENPLAGQGQLALDGETVDPGSIADGATDGSDPRKSAGSARVRAIGSTVAKEGDAAAADSTVDGDADGAEAGAIRLTDVAAMDEGLDDAGESDGIDGKSAATVRAIAGREPAGDSSGQSRQSSDHGASPDDGPAEPMIGGASALKKPDDALSANEAPTDAPGPAESGLQQHLQHAGTAESTAQKPSPTVQIADMAGARASSAPMTTGPQAAPAQPPVPAEAMFAQANHGTIVSSIRQELLPNGGTMHIRLDPPELGAMQVTVRMADGVVTASFQTSNDDATRLLSHSLHQLKSALESQGVTIDRLQVQQSPRDPQADAGRDDGSSRNGQSSQNQQDQQSRNEQQRRELMERLWRRMNGDKAPIDLVA